MGFCIELGVENMNTNILPAAGEQGRGVDVFCLGPYSSYRLDEDGIVDRANAIIPIAHSPRP